GPAGRSLGVATLDTLGRVGQLLGLGEERPAAPETRETCCQAQRISSALPNRSSGSRCSAFWENSTRPSRTLGSNFSASIISSSSVKAGSDLPSPQCGSTPLPSVISYSVRPTE